MELAGPEPEVQSAEEGEVPVVRSDPYLADFIQLGPQIYIYTPEADSTTEIDNTARSQRTEHQQQQEQEHPAPADPDLIIVCSWMYAQPRNIVKYTKVYQATYPRARILLLRQDGGDFFFRTQAQQMRNLVPAVSLIRELDSEKKEEGSGRELKVLLHIFSNGGAWTACQLADAYHHQQRGLAPTPLDEADHAFLLLPITALVLDSTPSLPNAVASHTAICEALPKSPRPLRALGSVLVWGYLGLAQAVGVATGQENVTLSLRRRLNDPRGAFARHGHGHGPPPPRVYIYSQADALIPAADVERHAHEAAQVLGRENVRLEDFVASRHVGHVLADPARYWAIIGALWRESASRALGPNLSGPGEGPATE
ncbi:hypothetical protein CLAIMM_11261 [Cladophialophora immunda]|nr:hypothetical protein CLAIMM_11261 [Cladophialophora immunda]